MFGRLGSARVSRAGFGVSPKQSSESPRKPGRFRQHARRVRYPDSLARQLIQIDPFTGLFNFNDHRLKEPCVCRLLRFDVERRFSFRAAQRMDRFASPTAPLTLLLPDTIPVCEIGEPIASITSVRLRAGERDFVSIRLFHYAGCKQECQEAASTREKHGQKTTERYDPFPNSSEPIGRGRRMVT